ncbi:isoamyl alcohol oxidase, putative [Rhizoctonia solani AG-3 Rhs1AP]|uniref:Isoamyl alcohol oxidase, putative n=1 Tax=Rhizoctonia solani AG-3 Rhs1AP TaxID=1086054 RepID=X8JB54_9AGAM|nr:isoamyl alcohol oxidase, putative [Rhizoctonia solani AG-3 Rhs1AP]
MRAILHLLKLGKPGVLRTLTIHMETHIQVPEFISTGDAELVEQATSILAPIDSLSLRGVRFAWDCPVYHNLVQLQISNIPYESSPHIRDILDILSACPLLRMLRISDMTILQGDTIPLEPVYLTQLEQLDLIALTYESLDLLLPLIVPQAKDLSLRITLLAFEDHLASAIHSFLKRTNVTRLFLQQDLVARCLPAVPNLRALVVDLGEQPGGACLSEFSHCHGSDDCLIPRCPNLHTLHFYSGWLPSTPYKKLSRHTPAFKSLDSRLAM